MTAEPPQTEVQGFVLPPTIEDEASWCAWADGLPASAALNLRCRSAGPSEVTAIIETSPWPLNPNGSMFGGLLAAGLDQTLGLAAMAAKYPDGITATSSLTCNFVRPAIPPLTFQARVVRTGRVLISLEGSVLDNSGAICAYAIGTWSATESARGSMR